MLIATVQCFVRADTWISAAAAFQSPGSDCPKHVHVSDLLDHSNLVLATCEHTAQKLRWWLLVVAMQVGLSEQGVPESATAVHNC